MYIPDPSSIPDYRMGFAKYLPLSRTGFTLDTSGVAGLFGGDEVVWGMTSVHLSKHRQLLGWYNSPGSYLVAKQYGLLVRSRFFESIFPGERTDPAKLFALDGWTGPKFIATHSGTVMPETGHLAALFMKECADLPGIHVDGRQTQPISVTIAEFDKVPLDQVNLSWDNTKYAIFDIFPIAISVGTCVACGIFGDWYSFTMILLGILTNGFSCYVIGSGKFVFNHPKPANGSPPGDGVLGFDKEIVLLKGAEGAVNSITRGWYAVHFHSEPGYEDIGWCSFFLTIQFIAQLLLIPQGSLFGQIMFVSSLVASWIYSLSLSSLNKEKVQRDFLLKDVLQKPVLKKYTLGTRTTMAVFVLLVLRPEKPTKLLNELLPNDTRVWEHWKDTIVQRLSSKEKEKEKFEFHEADWELDGFNKDERDLLERLYGDAQAAYGGYTQYTS